MQLNRRMFALRAAAASTFAVTSGACGYVLYPERRGRAGGEVDTVVLVVDLLWLLPGILPGVVFLTVDFVSGAIYEDPDGLVTQRDRQQPLVGELRLNGRSVHRGQLDREGKLAFPAQCPAEPEALRERGELVVQDRSGREAKMRISELIG